MVEDQLSHLFIQCSSPRSHKMFLGARTGGENFLLINSADFVIYYFPNFIEKYYPMIVFLVYEGFG